MSNIEDSLRTMIAEVVRDEIRKVLDEVRGDEYLSTQAAAELARVTDGTVRRWIRAGLLADHRAGPTGKIRILRTDLEALLRSGARVENDESPEALAERDFG